MTSDKPALRDTPIITSIALASADIPFLAGSSASDGTAQQIGADHPQQQFRRSLQLLVQGCERLKYVLRRDDDFSSAMRLAADLTSHWTNACNAYQHLFSIADADSLLVSASHAMLKNCRKRILGLLAVLFRQTEAHEESLRQSRSSVVDTFGAVTPDSAD